ncbi:Peroxidase 44 [Acorus gramineus]|uniref:Peroxidase n=1 Tax=Acorus gramineus TaxID=55184 RepID=A0AAV9BDM5_ACOGR|nr:Peroxidase 44 [Acorus gramineus]
MIMKNSSLVFVFLFFFFFFFFFSPLVFADLQVGFYNSSCPQAESIVQSVIQRGFNSDASITAALLRMYFHDCFVRGCDASILIDSPKKKSEKFAPPNLTVRGFDIIEEAKNALEAQCPATVSCADIIALSTRDAVALSGGPNYAVPTGRRDGLVSNLNDVNLPGPSLPVDQAFQSFSSKGLTLEDMVTLLGAHTVGVAHCAFFKDRLSSDATMDPRLRASLVKTCGSKSRPLVKDRTAFLDQNTSFVVDNEYYRQILLKNGVLKIDQEIALDGSTSAVVAGFASDGVGFLGRFGDALVKLGSVDVLVGSDGEIRKKCSSFNGPF